MTTISIITPSFNQGDFLAQTLESVKQQASPQFTVEHIVIDAGSTDTSVEILRRSSGVKWISEPDRGQSHAINKGFKLATGSIMAWLNSDDRYCPGALEFVYNIFEKYPDLDVMYGRCNFIDEKGAVIGRFRPPPFHLQSLVRLGVSNVPQPSMFFRRKVLDTIGPLDETLHFTMDYDFIIRIGQRFRPRLFRVTLSDCRLHENCKSVKGNAKQKSEGVIVRGRYHHESKLKFWLGYAGYKLWRVFDKNRDRCLEILQNRP